MAYILLLVLHLGYSNNSREVVITAEFNTEAACISAGKAAQTAMNKDTYLFLCAPKGKK